MWNYYKNEPSDILSSDSKSFKYKTSINGSAYNIGVGEAGYDANKFVKTETEVVIPLKHLSNFWRSLTWSKNCVLVDMTERDTEGDNPAIVALTELEFKITDTKLYVPVVTSSKENDTKLLQQLKTGFKRTIKWNKY